MIKKQNVEFQKMTQSHLQCKLSIPPFIILFLSLHNFPHFLSLCFIHKPRVSYKRFKWKQQNSTTDNISLWKFVVRHCFSPLLVCYIAYESLHTAGIQMSRKCVRACVQVFIDALCMSHFIHLSSKALWVSESCYIILLSWHALQQKAGLPLCVCLQFISTVRTHTPPPPFSFSYSGLQSMLQSDCITSLVHF